MAIPQYYHLLLRSKRAEMPMNLDGIRTTEIGYKAEWGVFTSCPLTPNQIPGRKSVPFSTGPVNSTRWSLLGWSPDGKVYGQYEVESRNNSNININMFLGHAYSDIDGDGNITHFRTSETYKPMMLTSNTIY